MTDRPDNERLSSEELIRRAREGFGDQAPSDVPPSDVPSEDEAYELPAAPAPPDAPRAEMPQPTAPTGEGSSLLPEHFRPEHQGTAAQPSLLSRLASKWGWIVVGVFGAVFIYNLVTGDTPVDDLGVGDCFISPTEEEITEVETVDCGEPHDYEVFALITLNDRSAFPGDAALFEEADEACFSPFLQYVDLSSEVEYYYDVFIPGESAWEAGNRESMCAIFAIDEDFNLISTTGSAKAE